jgi:hypothetical protein
MLNARFFFRFCGHNAKLIMIFFDKGREDAAWKGRLEMAFPFQSTKSRKGNPNQEKCNM